MSDVSKMRTVQGCYTEYVYLPTDTVSMQQGSVVVRACSTVYRGYEVDHGYEVRFLYEGIGFNDPILSLEPMAEVARLLKSKLRQLAKFDLEAAKPCGS